MAVFLCPFPLLLPLQFRFLSPTHRHAPTRFCRSSTVLHPLTLTFFLALSLFSVLPTGGWREAPVAASDALAGAVVVEPTASAGQSASSSTASARARTSKLEASPYTPHLELAETPAQEQIAVRQEVEEKERRKNKEKEEEEEDEEVDTEAAQDTVSQDSVSWAGTGQ